MNGPSLEAQVVNNKVPNNLKKLNNKFLSQ